MNPPGGYKSGKVYLKLDKHENGVKLYLNQNGKSI